MQTTTKSKNLGGDAMECDGMSDEVFLFIGNANIPGNDIYRKYFPNSNFVETFDEAIELLDKKDYLPGLIILDMPLNYKDLISFKIWKANTRFEKTPIIYSEKAVAPGEIKRLYQQRLVDDIVNLERHYNKLPQKARLIKKFQKHTSNKEKANIEKFNFGNTLLRLFDIIVSLTAIVLLLPFLLIIAFIIRIESKGPIIYSSPRAGKGFKIFKFYKFRSMVADADKKVNELADRNLYAREGSKNPSFFKIKDDPRITRFGKILRNTSLDELPQLLNVLKGDMSIVGNRPLPLYEAVSLTTDEWAERFMAPAGITGLWQISKRGKEDMSTEERISLDIDYARSRSLAGDFKIIMKTPSAILQKTNV
ncbi:MAG: hypothetical protein ABS68_13630 [Niastella sp. SCN 39-18]|nr:sugar transferase [Sphingobacteriales bacterium]ODT50728.1 MAG: hypothetical protein ABS68_13630 [Niastella sp. SCN 39-18]OJW07501.1 MAG: hypothetical protein BGO53_03030 [Sphingobacteriales bacterium 39-19]